VGAGGEDARGVKEEGDDDAEVDDILEVDGASLAPLVDASAFSFLSLAFSFSSGTFSS